MIHAGELKEVLKISREGISKDLAGGIIHGAGESFMVRGKYKDIALDQRVVNAQQQTVATVQFLVYFDDRIKEDCVVEHDGSLYDIVSIQRFGFRLGMILNCRTRRRGAVI